MSPTGTVRLVAPFVVAVLLVGPPPVVAAVLLVDIGQTGRTTEAGWQPFLADTSSPVTSWYDAPFGTGGAGDGQVLVQITAPHYRSEGSGGDYRQVTGVPGFNDLLSGAALMNRDDQTITLNLGNLADGEYVITTYHHSNYQPSSTSGSAWIDIQLTDSADTGGAIVHENVLVSRGTSSPNFTARQTMFTVAAGGTTTLDFLVNPPLGSRRHATLNAFALSPVKIWDGANSMDWDHETANWTGATWQSGDPAKFAGEGTGTVTLTENTGVDGIIFSANGYTIAGDRTIAMLGTPVISVAGGISATINANLAGTAGLTVQGGGTLTFGGSATPATGTLAVRDATLVIADGGSMDYGVFDVGSSSPGASLLQIAESAISADFRLLRTRDVSRIGTADHPYAAIAQKGGYAGFSDHLYLGNTAGSDVSYDLQGGQLDMGGSAALVIGSRGKATFTQTGGEVTARRDSGVPLYIGERDDGEGILHITGGTFTVAGHSSADVHMAHRERTKGMLILDGPDANMRIRRHLYLTDSSNAEATVNLNEGTLAVDGVFKGGGAGIAHFNMAGGTLQRYSDGGGTRTWVGFDTAARNFDINLSGTGSTISAVALNGNDAEINLYANLTGNGEIIFDGGTVNVRGANSHTGPTTVAANTTVELIGSSNLETSADVTVNGLLKANAGITVADGQTYRGTGVIDAATTVNAGGSLAPGESFGMLNFTDELSLQAGATLLWDFVQTGNAGEDYDSLTGTALILPNDGRVNLDIRGLAEHPDYPLSLGDQFTLFHGDVYEAGAATPFAFGAELNDYFNIVDHSGWWGTWELTAGSLILTAVPEPGTALLMLWALACGLLIRRKK